MRFIGSVVAAMSVAPESSELATISVRMVSSSGPTYAPRRSSSRFRRATCVSLMGTIRPPAGTVGWRSSRRSSSPAAAARRLTVGREQRVLERDRAGRYTRCAQSVDRGREDEWPRRVGAREAPAPRRPWAARCPRRKPALCQRSQLGVRLGPPVTRRWRDRAVRPEADPDLRERARGAATSFTDRRDAPPPPARFARAVTHHRPARASRATAPRPAGCSR